MADFHFVKDYEKHVAGLIARYPIDEAMTLAVGGSDFGKVGQIELSLLLRAGLRSEMAIFDLGCGSGRLAAALGQSAMRLRYLGTDVVQALLDYAATKAPRHFHFVRHRKLSVPLPDASVDIACAFSVFTHLLHHETYIYLEDMRRVVKPDGRVVFSFLEFAAPKHWEVFQQTVATQRKSELPALVQFIERNVIATWAARLGYAVEQYIDGHTDTGAGPLGQSVVVLRAS